MAEEFNFDEGVQRVFELGNETIENKRPSVAQSQITLHSAATGRPAEEVKADVDAGLDIDVKAQEQARGAIAGQNAAVAQNAINNGGMITAEELGQLREGTTLGSRLAADVDTLMADSAAGRYERKLVSRVVAFDRIISEYLPEDSEDEEGWLEWGITGLGRLGEAIVTDAVAPILPGVETQWASREKAQEISDLLHTAADDEEFEARLREVLDEANDRGVFSNANPAEIEQFVAMVAEAGVGSASDMAVAFTVLGATDLALPLAGVGIKTAAKGTMAVVRGGIKMNTPALIQNVASRVKAIDAGVSAIKANPGAPTTVTTSLPSRALPGTKTALAGPNAPILRQIEAESQALEAVHSAFVGKGLSPEVIDRLTKETTDEFVSKFGVKEDRIIDMGNKSVGLDTLVADITLGRTNGKPFLPLADGTAPKSAQELADRFGGTVVETVYEGKKAFVVKAERNINTNMVSDITNMDEVSNNIAAEWLSTTARTTKDLDSVLKSAESGQAKILQDLTKQYTKALKKAGKKGVADLDALYNDFLNDPVMSSRKNPLTEEEYTEAFIQKFGRNPKESDLNLWRNFNDLSNADYYLRANVELQKAVTNGETMLRYGDDYVRAKPLGDVDETKKYWVPEESVYKTGKELKDQGYKVFATKADEVIDPSKNGVDLIATKNPATRRMYHTDALGYNLGGHRVYANKGKFFVKQPVRVRTANGFSDEGIRAFMMTKTGAQAERTVEQFNNIVRATNGGSLTDDIIKANTDWNGNIQTVDEWNDFLSQNRLSGTDEITFDPDGQAAVPNGVMAGSTNEASFANLAAKNGHRGYKPLMEYGGNVAETINPSAAMPKAMLDSVGQYSYHKYMKRAMEGLIKAATKEYGGRVPLRNVDEVMELAKRGRLREAVDKMEFDDVAIKDKLELERYTIATNAGKKSRMTKAVEKLQDRLQDRILDSGKSDRVKWAAGKIVGTEGGDGISGTMRSLAFNLKLGLFAFDQIYVQAATVINSSAIASARLGVAGSYKTIAEYPVLRTMLHMGDNMRGKFAGRYYKIAGFDSADEFLEFTDFVERSGRMVLEGTAMEENVATTMMQSAYKKSMDTGRFFFDEGEKINRLVGMRLAYKEAKANAGPGFKLDENQMEWIMGRGDILTTSMTNASSASFQKSIGAVPFQFLTYQRNVAEQMFGSVLSKAEKQRMWMAQTIFFGAAGVPMAGAMMDAFGYVFDTETNDALRFGAVDWLIEETTGVDTALATRIGAGEGLWTTLRDAATNPIYETLGGPSIAVSTDVISSAVGIAKAMYKGYGDVVINKELLDAVGNISSASKVTKAIVAYRYGEYISSRNGRIVLEGLDAADAMAIFAGLPLEDVGEIYTYAAFNRLKKDRLKSVEDDVRRYMTVWNQKIRDKDFESAKDIGKTVELIFGSLTAYELGEVRRAIFRDPSLQTFMIQELEKMGKQALARELKD